MRYRVRKIVIRHLATFVTAIIWYFPLPLLAAFDHGPWQQLLQRHVQQLDGGRRNQVNYVGMLANRGELRAYLAGLAEIQTEEFELWSEADQLAFLINTYNAWTIELVLTEYPELDSIKDIGFLFSSPWRRDIVSLFGELWSLDDIEHGMIRGWDRYKEPRIHFAVNCAAIGCPALRAETYEGDRLEQQLEDNTRLFLSDRSRNFYANGWLYVSKIFDWYEEDFERGWLGINSVEEFLLRYEDELELDKETVAEFAGGKIRIQHLRYDWGLNQAK